MCIFPVQLTYVDQNRALLDTLRIQQSNNNQGHICIYNTLLIGHTKHEGHMRVSSLPFVPKQMHRTNHQGMVFIRPPGISEGAFQLRMDNIWFCKLLLLFKIRTMTDTGMHEHECAFVSVLEEYKGPWKSGHIWHIQHILHILHTLYDHVFLYSEWVNRCQSAIVYERREQSQVLYVIPVSSILGRLPLVPVGQTGTIPFEMRRESADFPGAACDKTKDGADGCRWWYVNSWALGWGTKQ